MASNNNRLSKVDQIVESMIWNMEMGKLVAGERLLSINDFSKQHGVARDTVEKAYGRLKKQGYIDAVAARGYFVLGPQDKKLRILFVFNKLSSYKKLIYDAFLQALGEQARVDIFVHHYSPELLKECLEDNLGKYHYYVIMPHFFNQVPETAYREVLARVPPEHLLLLDKMVPSLTGLQAAVYQDFKQDIYDALQTVTAQIGKYRGLTVIFPPHANHPHGISEGVMQFCLNQSLNFSVISHPDDEALAAGLLYIVLTESDLAILIKKVRQSPFVLGDDIGIISFNETVFKELLDITVITTDFEAMGTVAAQMILQQQPQRIRNPFKLIPRSSL